MRNFPNIEKLTGKNHYTGYAGGVIYHIHNVKGLSKPGAVWRASPISGGTIPRQFPPFLYGRTLAEVSTQLAAL